MNEREIKYKVIKKLEYLGYIFDDSNPNKDVFLQIPKSKEEQKKLNRQKPDFIIYDKMRPIAIIETKKENGNLYKAENQAQMYAEKLGIKIIFSYDGYRLFSKHLDFNEELQYGNTPLNDFVDKNILKKFISNYKIDFNFGKKIDSEKSFIQELKEIEDILWLAGLKKGDERFTEFCKILFLRLITEKENNKNIWQDLINSGGQQIHVINGNLIKLNKKYQMGKYGEELSLEPKYHSDIVKKILFKLDKIDFVNTSLDIKGSAFEFFLGVRGLSDDLAQYFTPRNIIRFMCNLVNPVYGEKIYDPFCGSGGILINAFEYVKKQIIYDNSKKLDILKKESIYGTDINNIAYVAKMNMILAGDGHANIEQQKDGSLVNKRTSKYDIIMTNIPFNLDISKLNYQFESLYNVYCKNGNSLCIQHCLDSLIKRLKARACIIVPEQFIFHQQLKETRKYIINNYDIKIFSLPQGVFEPYTRAKTCILYLEYKGNKGNLEFVCIKDVGFSLDKNKNKILLNDLTTYLKNPSSLQYVYKMSYEEIKNNDFSFLPPEPQTNIEGIKISDILEFSRNNILLEPEEKYFEITVKSHGKGVQKRSFKGKNANIKYKKGKDFVSKNGKTIKRYFIKDEEFCYLNMGAYQGTFGKINSDCCGALYSSDYLCFHLKPEFKKLNLDFLTQILNSSKLIDYFSRMSTGTTRRRLNKESFLKTVIPFNKKNILEYSRCFEKKQEQLMKLKIQQQKIEKEIKSELNKIF